MTKYLAIIRPGGTAPYTGKVQSKATGNEKIDKYFSLFRNVVQLASGVLLAFGLTKGIPAVGPESVPGVLDQTSEVLDAGYNFWLLISGSVGSIIAAVSGWFAK